MHLNSTTLNVAALMRRQLPAARRLVVAAAAVQRRPLHSSSRQESNLVGAQRRYANTGSGFCAPNAMASANQRPSSPAGNLNVFEDSEHLPSLAVPNLAGTLEKLKESISPVAMNSSELINTLKLIDKFAKSAGPKLDLMLRTKAQQTKNWLTHDWWITEAYLKSRRPLVINSNPAMVYPAMPFEVKNQRALVNVISQLISGIIDFKLALIHGYNPEATSASDEYRLDGSLCYSQYKNIFGGTRMPGDRMDSIEVVETNSKLDQQAPISLIVAFRGKFFEIQLTDIENEKGRLDKVADILEKILTTSGPASVSDLDGAGVFTTARRDEWAKNIKLIQPETLEALKGCQFVVCIDTIPAETEKFSNSLLSSPIGSEQHCAALGRQILHGDNANVGNRWFDKALQLVIVADEQAESLLGAGINYEHSFSEAMVVSKMLEHSYDKTIQKHREQVSGQSGNFFSQQQVFDHEPAVFRQLRMFSENDDANCELVGKKLKQARQDFASQVDQFDLSYLNYKNYGSNSIKSWHFSPDSWFQTALVSAYFNVHKRLGPCYESAGTRRFAYGRTETIRSLTKEVAQFCHEPGFETLQAAVKSHKAYALAAVNGNAIDRVLLGYRKTFDELKTNKWRWGPPSLHEGDGGLQELGKLLKLSDNKQDSALPELATGGQEFSIGDLFTEYELNVISSFFNNELIKRSNKFSLSTSQVSSIHPNIYMCYGAILADGYGCCYNITGQQIVAAITANSSNQSFSCQVGKLHEGIESSLNTMRDIVEQHRCKQ